MAEIRPFKGIIYNKKKVVDFNLVIAPPYDIISPELQERLYQSSPHNIVRLDFGKEFPTDTSQDNRYTRASAYLEDWLKEGILKRDEAESIYAYQMEYLSSKGTKKTLKGFVSLVKLEDLGSGVILPHENTYSAPRVDRLNLLKATRANLSLIFSLYSGERKISKIIEKNRAESAWQLQAKDRDGTIHSLHALKDTSIINEIVKDMGNRQIFIADGHHRYETSLLFRDEMRKAEISGYDYVPMFLADMEDEGLTILPTHRLIRKTPNLNQEDIKRIIEKDFDIKITQTRDMMFKELEEKNRHCFGMYMNNIYYLLTLRAGALEPLDIPDSLKALDAAILQCLLFRKRLELKDEDVYYEKDIDRIIKKIDCGDFCTAFFMNSPKVTDVKEVALSNERMPQKTTFFYPKLLTGMVINKFD